jgi:8-oxo-dGTP pyrophosphatase MutT (NUDIX family)
MSIPIRNAVRVLLLHDDKLLLMCMEGFDISTAEGTRNHRFWCTVGGALEPRESIQEAALREIYEETGIKPEEVTVGPVVWCGEVDLVWKGTLIHFRESYIVVKTNQFAASLCKATLDEQETVKKFEWFSLDQIRTSTEVIFPICLVEHLQPILAGDYPPEPVVINLKLKSS